MASKRVHSTSDDGATDEPATKRSRPHGNSKSRSHQNSHIDSTWGQKYVFSTREDATTVPLDSDSDLECDGDAEAMAYLSSVRQQAMGIPHLLVAPRIPIGPQLPKTLEQAEAEEGEEFEDQEEQPDRSIYEAGTGDFRGRYEDGAYIAQPDPEWDDAAQRRRNAQQDEDWDESATFGDEDIEATLREAYYASLLDRYLLLRTKLQVPPPKSVVAALPRTHGYHIGPKSSVFAVWNHRLRNTDPWPAQIAAMDKEAVIWVLRIMLSGKFLRRGYDLAERTSRWLWALLARLPDRGEMSHVDVGWVRDLGRRAVLMTQSLTHMANLREALEGEGMDLGVHDAIDESSDDEDALQEMAVEEGEDVTDSQSGKEASGGDLPSEGPAPEAVSGPDEPPYVSNMDRVVDTEDQQSEAMECSEDGEVADDEPAAEPESLEAAKARILAQLDQAPEAEGGDRSDRAASAEEQLRARLNMRATLNMILTVAGEFYGQRDLLEFRDPFTGM